MNRFAEDLSIAKKKETNAIEEDKPNIGVLLNKSRLPTTGSNISLYVSRLNSINNHLDDLTVNNEVTHKGIKALLR
jgi:hypothetical protein